SLRSDSTPYLSICCPLLSRSAPHPPLLHSFPTRRSSDLHPAAVLLSDRIHFAETRHGIARIDLVQTAAALDQRAATTDIAQDPRSEEHTSELQSRENLVCRLLLEKKKKRKKQETRAQYNK